jgi:hypothetical protein
MGKIWVVGLLAGHCHLKGHIFKCGLTNSPICERCLEKDESVTHILCYCEAIAYLRCRQLGHCFMEPRDYHDAPISWVLGSILCVGLIMREIRSRSTTDIERRSARAGSSWNIPYIYIYLWWGKLLWISITTYTELTKRKSILSCISTNYVYTDT